MNANGTGSPAAVRRAPNQLASISRREDAGVVVAAIEGEIDLSNAEAIGREIGDISNRALGMVLDIQRLGYLDSTAIALLYELHLRLARRGQPLIIVAPSGGPPRRVLELAAFDKQARLADQVEAAIAEVREATSGS